MDCEPGGSSSENIVISRQQLLEYYRTCNSKDNNEKLNNLFNQVASFLGVEDGLTNDSKQLLSKFVFDYKQKWASVRRNNAYFNRKECDWLSNGICFVVKKQVSKQVSGRPSKDFCESSDRSKRRKTEDLRKEKTSSELLFAAKMNFKRDGDLKSAKECETIIKKQEATSGQSHIPFTPDEALALVVGAKLTKFQYNLIRKSASDHYCNIYPPYENVTSAKKRCYPKNILVSESSVKIAIQDLLDHTAMRLVHSLHEVISSLSKDQLDTLSLITKWGCDGTSGQAEYKQLFQDETVSDSSIYLITIAPIQLEVDNLSGSGKTIIWRNPTASSPRSCRPLILLFAKESTDLIKQCVKDIETQIKSLIATKIEQNGIEIQLKHNLILCMIDGKTVNAITDTKSNQRCYLCHLTSKDFNSIRLSLSRKIVNEDFLNFGISPLHAWIRLFECLLHVSYRLTICRWQVRSAENKRKVDVRKKYIQEEFKKKMGLIVDKPKPGFGSSNDGNTARKFFHCFEDSGEITGINKNIIYRFLIILLALTSTFPVNPNKFKIYCNKTAVVFIKHYPWYPLPTTVHKILFHGHEIMKNCIVPLGLLSEEAQESRNKDIKMYRESYSRKFSRIQNLEDVFNNLLVSSDPYITDISRKYYKKDSKINDYPKELKYLLDM